MARLLLLTNSSGASADVMPALGLLQHDVKILPLEASVLVEPPVVDCLLIDARRELPNAKSFTKLITSTGVDVPIIVITTCLLYTSPSPRDKRQSRMPSSA